MSSDEMSCGCEGHADNANLCRYPALEQQLAAEQAERERDEAREYEDAARKHTRFVETEWAKRFDEVDAARERAEADNAALLVALTDAVNGCRGSRQRRCAKVAMGPHPGAAMLERMRAVEKTLTSIITAAQSFNHAEACDVDDDNEDSLEGCRCFLRHLPAARDALKAPHE
jgi:hypothetical protein